jgi:hypothetical protein
MFTWWRTNGERRATSASRNQGVEDQASLRAPTWLVTGRRRYTLRTFAIAAPWIAGIMQGVISSLPSKHPYLPLRAGALG